MDIDAERMWLYEKLKEFVGHVVEGEPSEAAEMVLPQIIRIMLELI